MLIPVYVTTQCHSLILTVMRNSNLIYHQPVSHWTNISILHLLTENQIWTLYAQHVRTAHCFFHISMFFLWALVKWSQTFLWLAAEKTLSIWPTDQWGETSTVRRNNKHPAQGGSFLLALHQLTYFNQVRMCECIKFPLSCFQCIFVTETSMQKRIHVCNFELTRGFTVLI